MTDTLAIWLYGTKVALVTRDRQRLSLSYTKDARDRFSLGTPLLSLSLPLTSTKYPNGVVRSFLDGLLPEGDARRAAADGSGLLASDTFGLMGALGRECAGALVFQTDDDPPPPMPTTTKAEPLSEDAIADLVANLPSAPLGASGRVRISLAGLQQKLLLTRMLDGSWGQPVDGTPSTHIIKPEGIVYPDMVANEAFCMRFAKHLGVPVADVETSMVKDRKVLVVERYDRLVRDDGIVERVHQEDCCQAVGISPDKKYQEDGGPSLRRMSEIFQAAAEPGSVEMLLRATATNLLVSNGYAHAKNFSLLHNSSGTLSLAPLYDLVCTAVYGVDELAMYVDDVRLIKNVTGDRLLNEGAKWGLSRRRVGEIVSDVLARAPEARDAARDETPDLPDEVLTAIDSQLERLREGL